MSCIVYIVLVWILCTKRESKRLFNDEQPYYITQLPFPHRCSQSCKKLPVILLEPEWSGHLGRIQLLNCQKVSLAFWLLSSLRFSFLAFAKPAVAKPFAHLCRDFPHCCFQKDIFHQLPGGDRRISSLNSTSGSDSSGAVPFRAKVQFWKFHGKCPFG